MGQEQLKRLDTSERVREQSELEDRGIETDYVQTVRIDLSLLSLLKLATILGVGYSIVSLMVFALASFLRGNLAALDTSLGLLYIVIAAFLQGLALPIIVTVSGYPLFTWLSQRCGGFLLSGRINSAHR